MGRRGFCTRFLRQSLARAKTTPQGKGYPGLSYLESALSVPGVVVWKLSFITNLNSLELACLATVSNQVIARKLEQERKKWKIEGGGRGGEGKRGSVSFYPLPLPLYIPLLCFRPNFLVKLARRNACYAGQFGHYIWCQSHCWSHFLAYSFTECLDQWTWPQSRLKAWPLPWISTRLKENQRG